MKYPSKYLEDLELVPMLVYFARLQRLQSYDDGFKKTSAMKPMDTNETVRRHANRSVDLPKRKLKPFLPNTTVKLPEHTTTSYGKGLQVFRSRVIYEFEIGGS